MKYLSVFALIIVLSSSYSIAQEKPFEFGFSLSLNAPLGPYEFEKDDYLLKMKPGVGIGIQFEFSTIIKTNWSVGASFFFAGLGFGESCSSNKIGPVTLNKSCSGGSKYRSSILSPSIFLKYMLQKPVWRPYFRLDMGYVYVQNFKVMDVSILSDQIATGTYQEVMFVQKGMLLSPSIGIQRIINDNFLKINFCLQFNYCFNGIDNEATKMNFNGEYPIINITADPTHFMSFHVGLIINLGSKRQ